MKWYELAMNPRAISELYTDVPSLQKVHLQEVLFDENGPRVAFLIDLATFPDKVPSRWKRQKYTQVQLRLDFWIVKTVQITGWPKGNIVDIAIEQIVDHYLAVRVLSSLCNIQLSAHDFQMTLYKK